ncbi:MAG: stage II sporulation protein D [Clostridium sp.]
MRNFKDKVNLINFRVSEKLASQIISVLTFVALGVMFLLGSTYFILGNQSGNEKNIESFQIENGDVKKSTDKKESLVKDIKIDTVDVYITKQDKIVSVPIEEYIKGVISSEMPVNFELEALKAQAVAARTYTVAHTKKMGGGCKKANGADLCDTTHCQVYLSKDEKIKSWGVTGEKNWKKIEQAVNGTKGQVLSYEGELAKGAYYFSTSSGKTENSEDVFVNALPYLRSVESKGEEKAPRYKSVVTIPYTEFVEKANNEYDANMVTANIKSQIKILQRTEGGSIKAIKLGDVTISGPKFRTLYGLNSANFEMNYLDTAMEIRCAGFGHGVGMSQWGANAMAKDGKKCADILKHYYTGIKLETINNKK